MEILGGLSETTLRLSAFAGIFAAMAVLELLIPKRKLGQSRARRWFTNLAIGGIDSLAVRLMALFVIPLAAVATAMWAQANGWGLLNAVAWPGWIEAIIAILVLDLALYAQHVASHKVPVFWRLHRVHHADRDIDVTTGIRFHPIEIGLSMLWKMLVVVMLGASPAAVVIFEIILNGCSMFNHSNIALPGWLDRVVRAFIVTPDMHRVHHSVLRSEHDTNFGFNLSVWDRLFRTYTEQPREGHLGMTLGLKAYQDRGPTALGWSLLLPFRGHDPRASDQQASSRAGAIRVQAEALSVHLPRKGGGRPKRPGGG